ncbi:ABC transporter substrate-binding protein [Sandaracinobacter sp. RS1-74]|uniref:ABC transporter substrate-binding protein n=1 Tax=Sandaracinobacteroides sayramensis TaxID=2913411 RepID=UPI001EDC188E|nr:ABC transporter substrate-binding protein [Sandaracinobacteroides sayramensis]MCG2841622.1 ABC transporter substrate-binding protein [Sandaracinobacteroides sayramensis]
MRLRPAFPALLAALLAAGCGGREPAVPPAVAKPLRVMSMNQCTDQILLALLPPERIASVTWLSRDPGGSLMADAARRVGVNHGQVEELLAQNPDLVIAGTYTTPALRGMLKRLGYPLIEVDHANSLDDVRRITREIAAAVGEEARGEALIADMDGKFAELARDPGPPIRVVAWDRTGFAAGEGTLYDVILEAAGARNLARGPQVAGYRRPDMEVLLETQPTLLVQGSNDAKASSLGDDVMRHRLVKRLWGDRTLFIRQAYYVCGTPMVADAAIELRAQLREAAARTGDLPPGRMPEA